MTIHHETRLKGRTRWSAAAKCPRWAAMGLLGYPPNEASDRTQRLWLRGKQLGAYMADVLAQRYENVELEKAVLWSEDGGMPLGELHTDVFVPAESLAIEVKSTTSPASMLDDALVQLAGEVYFDEDAENGMLAIIDPSDLAYELLPVILTPERIEQVQTIAAQVAEAGRTGVLPPCVCDSPAACRMKGCPFTDAAWEDWTPPDPENLEGDVKLMVTRLYQEKEDKKRDEKVASMSDDAYRETCEALVKAGLQPGVEYRAGPLILKISEVSAHDEFSIGKARKAGIWTEADDERFLSFIRRTGEHRRWNVKRDEDAGPLLTPEDFGEEAPF